MSNLHAYADACESPAPALTLSTIAARLAQLARRPVAGLAAASARLWPRDLSRYPDHLLADIGFERDWDGSIIAVTKEQSR